MNFTFSPSHTLTRWFPVAEAPDYLLLPQAHTPTFPLFHFHPRSLSHDLPTLALTDAPHTHTLKIGVYIASQIKWIYKSGRNPA